MSLVYSKTSFARPHILPPANEVWGKVIFSEACVKNSVHRGWGVVSQHALQVVSQHALQQRGDACSWGAAPRGGVCSQVGAWSRGLYRPTPKGEVEGDQVQAHTQGGN